MYAAFRTAPAVLFAATLAVATAACGSSSSSGTPAASSATSGSNALAGMSADQIAARAVADLGTSSSVHVSGSVTDSGQTIGLDLALARGEGCQGSMSLSGKGSFEIVNKGSTVWIKPTDAFYKGVGASGAAVRLLSGKWLKVPANGSGLGSLSSLCNASSLAHSFAKNATGFTKGPATTVNGQPAQELNQPSHKTHVFVSQSATPEILQIQGPKGQGYVNFTNYDAPATITTPPAGETLDGTKYGF
ncbi:MAG: hypothetical protein JOY82_07645 [Streptosporangiaceae bacterium]|nr:hypothetical protein [Streptosporangiaceae bacterium]MBV9854387.1 hypothetical protein [Streptosporangiaceae bacterium]